MINFSRYNTLRFTALLLLILPLYAAEPVQYLTIGTLLPVMLNSNLDSNKSKPGEKITAKLKQDVSLPDGGVVKSGAELSGHIVSVKRGTETTGSSVVFVFDQIRVGGQTHSIGTGLRALASMAAVFQARQPINAVALDGSSVWDYNTRQIGGDIVFGRKDVRSNDGVVGMSPEPGWVVGVPKANPDAGCDAPENKSIQAFWLFSTNACGVYGDDNEDMQISRKPSDNKDGQITLTSPKRVLVRGGGGLLLIVMPQAVPQSVK